MLTTVETDGALHSRPMHNQQADEAGDLWFFTYLQSPKTTEIGKDNHVNLAYSNPDKQHFVSISGKAEIVRDKQTIQEKWSEGMRAWFPKGTSTNRESRSFACIRTGRILGQPVEHHRASLRLREGASGRCAADGTDRAEEGRSLLKVS